MAYNAPHPIQLAIFETSKCVDAFRNFFKAYQENREIIKLNPVTDRPLVDFIEDTATTVFPSLDSSIGVNPEKRRQDLLYERFGIPVTGREEDFANVARSYKKFDDDFREIMVNVIRGIDDVTRRNVREADPAKLARDLNNLRSQLIFYNSNSSNRITEYWEQAFQRLVVLLQNDIFMRDFEIEPDDGINQRLIALGSNDKIKVPVSEVFESHLALAQSMEAFLLRVENQPNWTTQDAESLYATPADQAFFMEVAAHRKDIEPNNPDVDYVDLARNGTRSNRT
jgi:hypothetical protein